MTALIRAHSLDRSHYLQEAAMTEMMPLIVSVKRRLPERVNAQGWRVVSFEVETEKGAFACTDDFPGRP